MNTSHSDDLNQFKVEMTGDLVKDAVRYFTDRNIGWIYPSKSYMVGICYARWLSEEFGGNAEEYLDDIDLLYGNDPYFVEYSRDPDTYHSILNQIGGWKFNETQGMVPDVRDYFNEEFMINE
jgi:hypothetical protein